MRLSPTYGVNPSLTQCFYCGGDKNEIVLAGLMRGDREAPRKAVWDMEPCDTCKGYMAQGVMLISCRDEDEGKANPYRTGNMVIVTDDVIRRIVSPPELSEDIIRRRVAFVPDAAWTVLGLPVS